MYEEVARTATGVVCGHCSHGYTDEFGYHFEAVRHADAAAVRQCFNLRQDAAAEAAAEAWAEGAYVRHSENASWAEYALEEQMEAQRGVVSFSDAWDQADPSRVAARQAWHEAERILEEAHQARLAAVRDHQHYDAHGHVSDVFDCVLHGGDDELANEVYV